MHWEIQQGRDVTGPFSEDEILMMVEAGRVDRDTLVRPEGKTAWKPATRHGRFAAALRAVAARDAEEAEVTPTRRPPIDGVPFKDPARWDQQTQIGMPVATLVSLVEAPPPIAEPPVPAAAALSAAAPAAGPPPLPSVAPAVVHRRAVAPTTAPRVEPGFVHALFDVSFSTFVTTRVLKVLFVVHVAVVLCALLTGVAGGVLLLIDASAMHSRTALLAGLAWIALTPLACLAALIVGRMALECVAVFFRVAEHLAEIARRTPG